MSFYDSVVGNQKIVETKTYTYKLDATLEDGIPENEFTVSWTEETPTGFKYDNVYCAKYPAYVVNPIAKMEGYKMAFMRDIDDALMRFFAVPPDAAENAFFKNHEKLEKIFSKDNGWNDGIVTVPKEDTNYYIHIDLSQVKDRTVVALGHVEEWIQYDGALTEDAKPHIVIDLFRVWEPTRANPVNHGEVMDFVVELCRRFKVFKVTFDQWGSFDKIRYLNELGVYAEKQSLARPEYQEFLMAVGEMRLEGPYDERLLTELKHLVILPTGKIDHPDRHHNDISEAVCGVIRNCVENETQNTTIKIVSLDRLRKEKTERELREGNNPAMVDMPPDIRKWLQSMKAI